MSYSWPSFTPLFNEPVWNALHSLANNVLLPCEGLGGRGVDGNVRMGLGEGGVDDRVRALLTCYS